MIPHDFVKPLAGKAGLVTSSNSCPSGCCSDVELREFDPWQFSVEDAAVSMPLQTPPMSQTWDGSCQMRKVTLSLHGYFLPALRSWLFVGKLCLGNADWRGFKGRRGTGHGKLWAETWSLIDWIWGSIWDPARCHALALPLFAWPG